MNCSSDTALHYCIHSLNSSLQYDAGGPLLQCRMDQVTSSEDKKVRSVQFNDRVYTVGGLRTKNGLEWRPFSSHQTEHYHSASDVTSLDSQLLQAGVNETAGQNITNSLQQSSAVTVADGGSVTGCSLGASTAVTDLSTVNSWSQSAGQTTTAWLYPANMSRAPCEAASVAQVISHYQVASQQQNADDKLVFEDGLTHLRNLYESQLTSFRSEDETCLLLGSSAMKSHYPLHYVMSVCVYICLTVYLPVSVCLSLCMSVSQST